MTSEINSSIDALDDLIRLEGRRAVVTGGARGIGRAIAALFATAGAEVVIADIDAEEADRTASELSRLCSRPVRSYHLDCRSGPSVLACAEFGHAAMGGIDIWVNNAGAYPIAMVEDMSDEMWDDVTDLNLRGVFLGCREAVRRMRATPGTGRVIINIASATGVRGRPGMAHYSAAKHGVIGLTKSLAGEVGRHGIRVLAIAPTLVETPGVAARRGAGQNNTASGRSVDEVVLATIPLGRVGRPEDVARIALFCASDLSSFMTGSTLLADGGALANLF